jgi:type II secretory pathway pseudopilin PulG
MRGFVNRVETAPVLNRSRLRRGKALRRRGGFVLIEALAAFAILTMSLAALISGLSGAVRNDDRADFMLRATRLARSELEALGVESPPPPGLRQGRSDDGLSYAITVNYVPAPQQNNNVPMMPNAPTYKTIAFWAHIDVSRSAEATGKALTTGFDTFKTLVVSEDTR